MQKLYWGVLILASIVISFIGMYVTGRILDIHPIFGLLLGELVLVSGMVAWVWIFMQTHKKRLSFTMLSLGSIVVAGTAFGLAGVVPSFIALIISLLLILPNQAPPSDII